MRDSTIARSYAEALLSLASKAKDLTGWGAMISDVADAITRDERLRLFLESPRVSVEQKNDVIGKAFQDRMPRLFVRFLQAVVRHRRHAIIPEIAVQYHALVDEIEGRVHARVTVSREPNAKLEKTVVDRLSKVLGKTVVPHFTVDESILGGTIIRIGDTVMDGSVRRKLARLRQRMMQGA
ncbi:MAG TPA: F0F1 ATP synthase subunit delta [Gemmatimonadaceae bacterium]|nr:F0F1 ATP synthase subunit delta [Gemmatimonadaceae bacterium]